MNYLSLCLAATAAFGIATSYANAADYDPPIFIDQVDEVRPVEIGSGWYLRGDVGYNLKREHRDFGYDYPTSNPIIPTGYDEKSSNLSGSVGFGYHFNDFLRADLNVGYLSVDRATINGLAVGGCGGTRTIETQYYDAAGAPFGVPDRTVNREFVDCATKSEAKTRAWNGMVNGYVDLGTFVGFTPYIGGGVGLVYTPSKIRLDQADCYNQETITGTAPSMQTTNRFQCDGTPANDGTNLVRVDGQDVFDQKHYSLAYSLAAGFSYALTKNASVDVGYQYTMAPDAQYVTVGPNGFGVDEGLKYHQVKVGLRYDLW